MYVLSDEEKKQFFKIDFWIRLALSLSLFLTTIIVVNLHGVVPWFPLLFIFDAYWLLIPFSPYISKKYQRFFMLYYAKNFKDLAIDLLPFTLLLVLIHLVYWTEVCVAWNNFYKIYFN